MSAVTKQEIVEALRRGIPANAFHKFDWIESNKALANRIEQHGIAPSDNVKQADEETHRRVDEAVRDGRIVDKREPEVKP